MKPWQHGIELDVLINIEHMFKQYNSFSLSPFSSMKKHVVAEAISKDTLVLDWKTDSLDSINYGFRTGITKSKSPIRMCKTLQFAEKVKGDRWIDTLTWTDAALSVDAIKFPEPTWLMCWSEDDKTCKLVESAGYKWVGTKVTSFAELISVYSRNMNNRYIPPMSNANIVTLTRVDIDVDIALIESIANKLPSLPEYTNHYSNYNKDRSWSALSLRGYSDDVSFISKPSEMNKKWKEENVGVLFEMQDTKLMKHFPEVRDIIASVNKPVHRVRFMNLDPSESGIGRHTDQVDIDSGVDDGKVVRFHWPIITNDNVAFSVWELDGSKTTINMKTGECWYLDTRKPHAVINGGDCPRIHLVIDFESDGDIRSLLGNEPEEQIFSF